MKKNKTEIWKDGNPSERAISRLVKSAKKIAKDYDEKWECTFAEIIIWSFVNMVEMKPEIWKELREKYLDKELIEKFENGKSNKYN